MPADSERVLPSTTEAASAQAQTREGAGHRFAPAAPVGPARAAAEYTLGDGVTRADRIRPYERRDSDPVYRPLRIFTRDPATSLLDGSIALINLPYEPLAPGPEGSLFRIDSAHGRLNLEDPALLIRSGVTPSMSNYAFHSQMAYAVCTSVYTSFRAALGRYVSWGFSAGDGPEPLKLTVRPHGFEGQNAFYEKRDGTLSFGYYKADKRTTIGNNLPGGRFFTCLSHDIVAHEVTHALLDGLRANFTFPSTLDVLAFHEAFADIVAIFQHFSYDGVLHAAIRSSGADLKKATLLTNVAEQFGQTTSGTSALRTAVDSDPSAQPVRLYGQDKEPHAAGSVLVAAVFEAFNTIFQRRVDPYIRLATNGTGNLPPGQLAPDLVDLLAKTASRIASHFLAIMIRSIDYCPPVDLRFGDFLRAIITADHDLVPDDPYAYREAIIDAFRRRAIFPLSVESLSEDALIWGKPRVNMLPIASLNFASLRFRGDPQNPAGAEELRRQARCLGDVICSPFMCTEFGLISPDSARSAGLEVDLPVLQSIRSSRRVGPDGQVVFDLIAEVTQRRVVTHGARPMDFYGGATIILGPEGEIRYVVSKSITSESRLEDQRQFVEADGGKAFWEKTRSGLVPRPEMFRMLHELARG